MYIQSGRYLPKLLGNKSRDRMGREMRRCTPRSPDYRRLLASETRPVRPAQACAPSFTFQVRVTIKNDVVGDREGAIKPIARGTSMRLPVLSFPFMASALLSCSSLPSSTPLPHQTQAISPQSSNEYAWCAVTTADSRSCYYASRQQCLDANDGLSFLCVANPRYRPPQVLSEAAASASDPTAVASPGKRQQSQ
jgi:hypothetical protein